MIYLPIIGAIAVSIGTIFQKVILKKKSVKIQTYETFEFLAIALIMVPLLFFFWKLDPQALQIKNIIIFLIVILTSILANLALFYSMKWEKINNIEPAKMIEPIFVILLAIIFSFFFDIYERNMKIIIPALIAGSALIFSHIKKHHLNFNKYFLAALAGSFLFSLELVTSKLILGFYSPISFYFIRCISIFIISYIIFRPKLKSLKTKIKIEFLLLAFLWATYRIIVYYGYINLGIISTTLVLLISPILIYLFARIFLKEKISSRNIIASIIILACVLYSLLLA